MHGITVWFSSPSVISLARRWAGWGRACMPSLRLSLFCGEPLLRRRRRRLAGRVRSAGGEPLRPDRADDLVYRAPLGPRESPSLCVNDIVPIGTMHPGLRHSCSTRTAPDRVSGEFCVTGPQMFPGYLDPDDDSGRFLSTTACAGTAPATWRRLPNADLAYLGRRDYQVKIHGVRVELAEVEWGMRRLGGVTDAVAIALAASCRVLPGPGAAARRPHGGARRFFPRTRSPCSATTWPSSR